MLMFNAPPAPDNRDHTKEGLPWGLGIIRHESSVQALTRHGMCVNAGQGAGGNRTEQEQVLVGAGKQRGGWSEKLGNPHADKTSHKCRGSIQFRRGDSYGYRLASVCVGGLRPGTHQAQLMAIPPP